VGLLTTITNYLEQILNSIAGNLWLSVLFIFLVCIGEAVFIAGLLVPSLPILLLTGGLIAAGKLPFWPIYFAAVAGAVIGDAISYWIGHAFKDRIKLMWPFRNYLHLIEQGEIFFQKHGGAAIFIGRFVTGVKAVIPGIAGMLGMPWRHFTFINVISAFVWAGAHILPGMLLGAWLESIGLSLELVILVGSAVLIALALLVHYWKRIVLLFTPYLGEFGKSLEARWRKPKTDTTAS
jgi:membrane protein DedA with SNARE-associated domain